MAHPIFKPEPNIEYPLEMLAGPYGDNDTKGPVQGKFGPQWRYLVKVRDAVNAVNTVSLRRNDGTI